MARHLHRKILRVSGIVHQLQRPVLLQFLQFRQEKAQALLALTHADAMWRKSKLCF
jgi:hypothetical protein